MIIYKNKKEDEVDQNESRRQKQGEENGNSESYE